MMRNLGHLTCQAWQTGWVAIPFIKLGNMGEGIRLEVGDEKVK